MPQALRHAGYAPVVVGKFQGLRHRLYLEVGRNPAIQVVELRCVHIVLVGCGHHGPEGTFPVKRADPAEPGIGNDRHGMVANHTSGFVTGERPYRQLTQAIVVVQEGIHYVSRKFGVDKGLQRMPGTERIPDGKGGIEMPLFQAPVLSLLVPVQAVHIVNAVGCLESVVEVGIKHIRGTAFNLDGTQGLRPTGFCPGQGLVKIRGFRQPVFPGSFLTGSRKARHQADFLHFVREGEQHFAGPHFQGTHKRN